MFEPAPEGGYVVCVPALPGCVTAGETLEEAREMAGDAIRCYVGSLKCFTQSETDRVGELECVLKPVFVTPRASSR